MTSWHDGWPASQQSFTVKDRPKHRLGETSDYFLLLPVTYGLVRRIAVHAGPHRCCSGLSRPQTEHPFNARKDVLVGGAEAPNRIAWAVKGLRQ